MIIYRRGVGRQSESRRLEGGQDSKTLATVDWFPLWDTKCLSHTDRAHRNTEAARHRSTARQQHVSIHSASQRYTFIRSHGQKVSIYPKMMRFVTKST